jgi:uroporphyrinogen-III synthase
MKILLTRPEPDASATAATLSALGHTVLSLPVTDIMATGAPVPDGLFTALLATSANAFRSMNRGDVGRLKGSRLFCVGAKTARIARDTGFIEIETADGSGQKLVAALLAAYPSPSHFLYLTGTPRKPLVEQALRQAGHAVTCAELYAARPVSAWPEGVQERLAEAEIALHFSRGSVEALIDLAVRSNTLSRIGSLRHLCLSEDVALPLRAINAPDIRCSAVASEAGLLAELASISF